MKLKMKVLHTILIIKPKYFLNIQSLSIWIYVTEKCNDKFYNLLRALIVFQIKPNYNH